MKHRMMWVACVLLLLPIVACQEDTPLSPPINQQDQTQLYVDPEQVALAIMEMSGWPSVDEEGIPVELANAQLASPGKRQVVFLDREIVTGDIAHYSLQLRVGPGEYDVIGIHRVVKERRPVVPIHTARAVFLVHGAGKDFVGNYLPGLKSPRYPDDFGHAVFLAQNDVDVWGIDSSYLLVPTELPDFAFMAEWGVDKHITDLNTAIETARVIRRMTGNGYRKMILSGYSAGAAMSYAYLNEETQRPRGLRKISGFIPVDWGMYTDNPAMQDYFCNELEFTEDWLEQGIYGYYDTSIEWGYLARDYPNDPSPNNPAMTNLEFLLTVAATGSPEIPAHYWAGIFNEEGTAIDMQYTEIDMLIDFWITFAPAGQPVRLVHEAGHTFCPYAEGPWDEHAAEIEVPVLHVSAAGGFGPDFEYTLGFLGSDDVSNLAVALHGSDERLLDFGHVDLYTANDAQSLWWQPMLDWIIDHTQGGPN